MNLCIGFVDTANYLPLYSVEQYSRDIQISATPCFENGTYFRNVIFT
jgi:hypothetical protein